MDGWVGEWGRGGVNGWRETRMDKLIGSGKVPRKQVVNFTLLLTGPHPHP